jgi:hypothetical protein
MRKHNEPSEGFPAINLSSEEKDVVPDTSWDEDTTRKLFSNLNHGILGPLDDGNIIIISNFEEEEVHEDDHANTDAVPSSLRFPPTPSASIAADNDELDEVKDDSSESGDEAGTPQAVVSKGLTTGACTEEMKKNDSALLHYKFFYEGKWRWWCKVIASLMPFIPLVILFCSYCPGCPL